MISLLACLTLARATAQRPLVLAHFMPWYESKPVNGHWGWHWTMNHFDPDKLGPDGRQQLASQFRPLIGAYDSCDPDALECQTFQMKIAGIDGVLIDWYGVKDLNDYALINRNTQKMIDACAKAGLKFGIVMEDQVVPQLVKAGKSSPDEYAASALAWMGSHWFNRPGYIKWHGRPILLMFGPQYYKDPDLSRLFGGKEALFTLLGSRGPAVGAFGWPEPQVGDEKSWAQLESYSKRSSAWAASIPVAYPRFEDIYKAAGVGPGYGEIQDRQGATFLKSLTLAESVRPPFVQIATWNDWGEGTQIEPSLEFGYRDLELLQTRRRGIEGGFPYGRSDLRLPAEIYLLRKKHASPEKLNRASAEILAGRPNKAAAILSSMSQ